MLNNIKSDFDKYCSDQTRLHSKMHMNCMMYNSLFGDTNYTKDTAGLLKLENQLMFVDRLYIAEFGSLISRSNTKSKKDKSYKESKYIDAVVAAKMRISGAFAYLIRCVLGISSIEIFGGITWKTNKNGVSREAILEIAAKIDAIAREIAAKLNFRNGNGPISFLSKFVHFTTGISPIYDSNVIAHVHNVAGPMVQPAWDFRQG
jgi:hypothetical protein